MFVFDSKRNRNIYYFGWNGLQSFRSTLEYANVMMDSAVFFRWLMQYNDYVVYTLNAVVKYTVIMMRTRVHSHNVGC